uniref:Amine oxidase domain-containing protein n=1 Tax=Ditylum brightwellii TaxID=49249 RepID=A0A7S4T5Q1_9STRA
MGIGIKKAFAVFSTFFLTLAVASPCRYLDDAPVVEAIIPSLLHLNHLKFLNVDATVYRHTLTKGSLPRLSILEYSSAPIIEVNTAGNEVIISTKGNSCVAAMGGDRSDAHLSSKARSSFFITTLFALAAAPNLKSLGFLSLIAIGILSYKADAAGVDECTPSMKVVLEAPPYYLGSVDECFAEVSNPDHCPEDFPAFETCSDPSPSCELAVVGAGTSGLYTAMRLVEEDKFSAKDICIFEATERAGGRIYSLRGFGPEHDITVDAGAYRTWPEFTPTTHALIEKLGFQMECYEDEDPCQKFNIIGDNGEKIGFASFVEEMLRILVDKGACFFPRHELISIDYEDDESKLLVFANGVSASAKELILNMPQRPLLQVMRKSSLQLEVDEESRIFDSLHSVQTEIVTKLYLYYNNSWWHDLGLTNGDFEMPGDARNMVVKGRYHDGHVKCGEDGSCYGFLLADYVHDFGGEQSQFFRRYQRDRPEPVTIISNTDIEGRAFLNHAHNRLVEFHRYENENADYTGFQAQTVFRKQDPPEFAVLATWNIATFGAGGGWHHWTDLDNVDKAMKPMNELGIHVINEAYSKLQGWAGTSL